MRRGGGGFNYQQVKKERVLYCDTIEIKALQRVRGIWFQVGAQLTNDARQQQQQTRGGGTRATLHLRLEEKKIVSNLDLK